MLLLCSESGCWCSEAAFSQSAPVQASEESLVTRCPFCLLLFPSLVPGQGRRKGRGSASPAPFLLSVLTKAFFPCGAGVITLGFFINRDVALIVNSSFNKLESMVSFINQSINPFLKEKELFPENVEYLH